MNARGYQVLDVILVCLLIGFLSTWGVVSLHRMADQQRLQTASQIFLSMLANARFHSVAKNLPTQIRIHPSGRKFALAMKDEKPSLWQNLPKGVEFSTSPANPLSFYSRGNAAPAGSYTLRNQAGEIKVVVSFTGRLSWERMQ